MHSLFDSLEKAKDLYNHEMFHIAANRFGIIAEAALPASSDIWLNAIYGLAECQRINGDFENGLDTYRRLLSRGCFMPLSDTRLALPNRVAIIYSFISLMRIGRLSLKVGSPEIDDIAEAGMEWAEGASFRDPARMAFIIEKFHSARNRMGPSGALLRMKSLIDDLDAYLHHHDGLPVVNSAAAKTVVSETNVDACIYDEIPNPPDRQDPAFHWVSKMRMILKARMHIARNERGSARRLLENAGYDGDGFKPYPDLDLQEQGVRVASLHLAPEKISEATRFAALLERQIRRALAGIGDCATPLWLILQMLIEFAESNEHFHGKLSGNRIDEQWRTLMETLKSTVRDVCTYPSVANVLLGRGFSPEQIERIECWTASDETTTEWLSGGIPIVKDLARAVRP